MLVNTTVGVVLIPVMTKVMTSTTTIINVLHYSFPASPYSTNTQPVVFLFGISVARLNYFLGKMPSRLKKKMDSN